MDKQIEIVPVSPGQFSSSPGSFNTDPWIAAGLRRTVKTFGDTYSHERIGIVIIPGFMENLDFANTDAYEKSKRVDAIAIWIPKSVTYPPLVKGGPREHVIDDFTGVAIFAEVNPMLKMLVAGCENQLVRKVILVGAEIFSESDHSGHWVPKWISVPLSNEERFPGNLTLDLGNSSN